MLVDVTLSLDESVDEMLSLLPLIVISGLVADDDDDDVVVDDDDDDGFELLRRRSLKSFLNDKFPMLMRLLLVLLAGEAVVSSGVSPIAIFNLLTQITCFWLRFGCIEGCRSETRRV